MKFIDLKLSKMVMGGLEKQGFDSPTEIQEKTIPLIMDGQDVIGKSQTGSGKTYAYGIPAIESVDLKEKVVQVLVICPTRELVSQVCDELRKLVGKKDLLKITPIFGGANMDRQKRALKDGSQIVIGTPGRLMDHMRKHNLNLTKIKMLVLDEADEMLNMGFREDIETILKATNKTHQTTMFSATMPKPILDITKLYMKEPQLVELSKQNETASLVDQYYAVGDKKTLLSKTLSFYQPTTAIVFCNTKRMVDEINYFIRDEGYKTISIHGDMKQAERKRSMEKLKNLEVNILVATDVAARGIDIKNVDIIFNFDIPNEVENYIHRIGRTGRAGNGGKSITFVKTNKEKDLLLETIEKTKSDIKELEIPGVLTLQGDVFVLRADKKGRSENNNRRGRTQGSRDREGRGRKESRFRGEKRQYDDKNEKSSRKTTNKNSAFADEELYGENKSTTTSKTRTKDNSNTKTKKLKRNESEEFWGEESFENYNTLENSHKAKKGFDKRDMSKKSSGRKTDTRNSSGERNKSFGNRKGSFLKERNSQRNKKDFGRDDRKDDKRQSKFSDKKRIDNSSRRDEKNSRFEKSKKSSFGKKDFTSKDKFSKQYQGKTRKSYSEKSNRPSHRTTNK